MDSIAIIPARIGSKGIKEKNLKMLVGQPLVTYTIKAALESKISDVFVSTDSEEIARVTSDAGASIIMRPGSLATDSAPTLPVIQHALEIAGRSYSAVVTLQPTSPLRKSYHIDEALEQFFRSSCDSLVSVVEVPHNMVPESIMQLKNSRLQAYLPNINEVLRRQEKCKYYARNGAAIYITRIDRINDYIFGGNISPYIMDKISSIDIDDIDDWRMVESILKNNTAKR